MMSRHDAAFDGDDDDDFQDACDSEPVPPPMSLEEALVESEQAISFFFNNKFDEARNLMKPYAASSMYHSVGNCVFTFLEAMLTFEQVHISVASEALRQCLSVCNRNRRKNTITESIGKTFKKSVNYDQYSDCEIHAELCYAESLLLKAMLTFVEDETLGSLIKGGMKIRTCYHTYKECNSILTHKRHWDQSTSRVHFESGVRMGIGTFNLMISLLPGRVIRLLEFIGFSGNKQIGIQDLELGYRLGGVRQVLCVMILLGYHLVVCYVLSHQEGDLEFCDEILNGQLKIYPDGVWFLFFKGRLEFMKGNLESALSWYRRSWKSQSVWPQFHHLCFWELLWVNCIKLNWREASLYAAYLVETSKWSRTIYTYQKAAILCMMWESLTDHEKQSVEQLLKEAPQYKQRIAGKSLPMEKFAVKKSERFFAQNSNLVLPALELMYVWNLFKVLSKQFSVADQIYKIIEKELTKLNESPVKTKFECDNRALVLLLKGACLRQMSSPLQALKCLENVIGLQKELKEDLYVVPYAIVEIGLLYASQGQKEKAIAALEDAKKNYKGYSLESRLHFRIHTALTELKGKNEDTLL